MTDASDQRLLIKCGISPASVPVVKILVFNRPFALLLCDTQTNTILFVGVVYEPAP